MSDTTKRGKIIVLEGMDAAGKASHSKALVGDLHNIGQRAHRLSFPNYETVTGKAIAQHLAEHWLAVEPDGKPSKWDPLAFQALMTLNRFEAAPWMDEMLADGAWLVLDRYWPSGVCYGAADGIDPRYLELIHKTLPKADLMILMDVPPEESVKRRPDRRDRYEKQAGLMARVRDEYLALFERKPDAPGTRWERFNALGEFDDVHHRLWDLILDKLFG